jgi:hypothetical protein
MFVTYKSYILISILHINFLQLYKDKHLSQISVRSKNTTPLFITDNYKTIHDKYLSEIHKKNLENFLLLINIENKRDKYLSLIHKRT